MKFIIVLLILVTLVIENLVVVVVCKRKNDFGDNDIIGNYDDVDETSKLLNELKDDLEKDEIKKKNKNKISFNDDVNSLEEDAAKAKQPVTPSSKLPQAASMPSSPSSPSTTRFINNNHEDDASHSWTIFFILCILGKYNLYMRLRPCVQNHFYDIFDTLQL